MPNIRPISDLRNNVWDAFPRCCSLIHPAGLKNDMEKAVADGKVMEIIADLDFMNRQLNRPISEVLAELKEDDYYSLVDEFDVISLAEWVGDFSSDEDYDEDFDEDFDEGFENDYPFNEEDEEFLRNLANPKPNVPIRKASTVGRNDPCPCGSGKKYKKCCLGKEES